MKLKVLGWILIATIGIAVLDNFNMLGNKKFIEVQARYMQYTCGKNNIDMRVVAVTDSSNRYLIGQTIAPELLNFGQAELARLVYSKTAAYRDGRDSVLRNFTLIGNIRESEQEHCSAAKCFKVEKIKYSGDEKFTEF